MHCSCNELYKVVTVGETGNYSVANVGDTNGDGTVDVNDYQVLVNAILNEDPEQEAVKQIETASYDDIVKYDLDGDGYLDVIDAYLLHLFINGFTTVDVYAVGDYDLNGVAFEEADIKAIKHAIENHWFSIVFGRSEEIRGALPYDSLRENPIVFSFAEGRSSLFLDFFQYKK